MMSPTINPLSSHSLRLEPLAQGNHLKNTSTGFVIEHNSNYFIVTNWHVVTGKHPDTNCTLRPDAAVPQELTIVHHSENRLGEWTTKRESLYEKGNPLWLEHPNHEVGRNPIDVILLPLSETVGVELNPLDLQLADIDIIPQPGMNVFIIGFPLGLTAGGQFPVWKTGNLASEPALNYRGRPMSLIDARTTGGMSGSPVILHPTGSYKTSEGVTTIAGGPRNKFLGVYSGRLTPEFDPQNKNRDMISSIGMVWKPSTILDIINHI